MSSLERSGNLEKDRIGRLALREDNIEETWKDYFEYLYNLDTE